MVNAVAEAQSTSNETPTIHVSTDLIEVPVLALRPPFRPASGLTTQDFNIRLDGGPPFHPRFTRVEGDDPVNISLLVDADPKDAKPVAMALQALLRKTPESVTNTQDHLAIYVNSCHLLKVIDVAAADINKNGTVAEANLAALTSSLESQISVPCTHPVLSQALQAVILKTQNSNTRDWRILILIDDGRRVTDASSLAAVQKMAAEAGVTIFTIKYIRNGSFPASIYSVDEGINILTSSLGGITIPSSFEDLGQVFVSIMEDVRQRYILSFSRPKSGDAGTHRLDITTQVKGVKVLASAVSAPVLDDKSCISSDGTWLCGNNRPEYGSARKR